MALTDAEIGDILLGQSYLSEEELKANLKQGKERKLPLLSVLMEKGLLTQALYENALAEHYSLPFFDIQENPPSPELVGKIPEDVARTYSAIVIKQEGKTLTVATSDPGNETLDEAIRINFEQEESVIPEQSKTKKGSDDKKKTKKKPKKSGGLFSSKKANKEGFSGKIELVFSSQENINSALRHYRKPLATRFQSIIEQQGKVAPEILGEIIDEAIELRASDIHFEPQGDVVIVRFRVDGVLHEAGRIQKIHYEGVVNRVKIEANMRIDEHFGAQDGAIRHKTSTGPMDIRVNIVPIVDGEKIVMRLLAAYVRTLSLADLGFSEEAQQILEKAAHKPFGMILTTGPTGSGKSTTLSALLKMRNHPDINISTIEDPVEYKIRGVNHIQVNPKANLTFASGLRALVRQDPDVILVGEIRDGETADISVNAALTGHLLFSTLHSNDSATATPRLLDMGVEPFLLASTLEVIIGQRLVRRICPECRYSYAVSAVEAKKLFAGANKFFKGSKKVTLYKGKGCDSCGGTGFKGRVGIYELLEMTPEIEELVIARATSAELSQQARKQGMKLMFEDGFQKALSGLTTMEELMRVAAPPDIIFSRKKNAKKKK
jgi:type IV pilus assembly protein PilB